MLTGLLQSQIGGFIAYFYLKEKHLFGHELPFQ